MGATIGQLLALALGIAIRPLPIIAGILMLMSPRARSKSVGFLLGWLAGIAFVITVFSLLSSLLPEAAGDGTKPVLSAVQIALGLLLLLLAFRQWRGQPHQGAQPTVPKWMQRIDGMSFTSPLGLGLLLSAGESEESAAGCEGGRDAWCWGAGRWGHDEDNRDLRSARGLDRAHSGRRFPARRLLAARPPGPSARVAAAGERRNHEHPPTRARGRRDRQGSGRVHLSAAAGGMGAGGGEEMGWTS